jgi:hypothetical protein
MSAPLTTEKLRELLHYEPETGRFTWLVKRRGHTRAGDEAGRIHENGYRMIKVSQVRYLAHRLAWFYVRGEWPANEIDHINRDRADNRIANLRTATHAENGQNRGARAGSKSGVKGVSWMSRLSLWEARITVNGKTKYLGTFAELADASRAYQVAAEELHSHREPAMEAA